MKKYVLGLLSVAALSSPVYLLYTWFDTNYLIMSKADAMQLFQFLMLCMGGIPVK